MPNYNSQAVEREIRRDPRISAGEARLIKSLLKGRQPVAKKQQREKTVDKSTD